MAIISIIRHHFSAHHAPGRGGKGLETPTLSRPPAYRFLWEWDSRSDTNHSKWEIRLKCRVNICQGKKVSAGGVATCSVRVGDADTLVYTNANTIKCYKWQHNLLGELSASPFIFRHSRIRPSPRILAYKVANICKAVSFGPGAGAGVLGPGSSDSEMCGACHIFP